MVRVLLLSFLLATATFFVSAQTSAVEQTFEKNKARYTREHFVMGEDASSGYDYLFYKSGAKIVMIRSIWSASYTNELRIEDFYFDNDLALHRKQTAQKRQLGVLKRGRNIPLVLKQELHFGDGKLTRWIIGKKIVPTTDPRWPTAEKDSLESAKSELESYSFLKEGN